MEDNGQRLQDIILQHLTQPLSEVKSDDLRNVRDIETSLKDGLNKIHKLKFAWWERKLLRPKQLKEIFRQAIKAVRAIDQGRIDEGVFRIRKAESMMTEYTEGFKKAGDSK
ncbi:hypothetical protein [Metabacillus sp. Hm71]|uniref:hypothetical protein n=1 Tax=Metabacillus sp. Hm71 TaxID=3450743 RepID=UPI003F41B8B8